MKESTYRYFHEILLATKRKRSTEGRPRVEEIPWRFEIVLTPALYWFMYIPVKCDGLWNIASQEATKRVHTFLFSNIYGG